MPIVAPTTESSRKKIRWSSAGLASPDVAPATTIVPPGRSERTEWDHVAAPTVSITASTRRGRRAPGSTARTAPREIARSRLAASRLVAKTSMPVAAARAIAADATPPPTPCTSTLSPGETRALVKSIRYAVSHAVGTHAASENVRSDGLSTRFQAGTATCSASVPGYRSERIVRPSVGPTPWPVAPMTACTTTSRPSAVTPAASVPRIIGSWSARSPTPRNDQRSWWFSAAARTSTVDQPAGGSGAGRSPTSSPLTGSCGSNRAAYAASMRSTYAVGRQGGRPRGVEGRPPRHRRASGRWGCLRYSSGRSRPRSGTPSDV